MTRFFLVLLFFSGHAWALPAFPGAQGFGSETQGGRGGNICKVTTLADSGAGSLRECIEQQDPRIVVFAISGVIRLASSLHVRHPFISIFGQTAPGQGVMITSEDGLEGAPLMLASHNIIIQHLRIRAGNNAAHAMLISGVPERQDGHQAYNIIVDHCSLSGGYHAVLAVRHDAHNLTISNSLIGPGLASHDKVQGQGIYLDADGGHSISLHHNLIAHTPSHSPGVKTGNGVIDIVNNLIYNWGENSTEIISHHGAMQVNLVHNLYIRGQDSTEGIPEIIAHNQGEDFRLFLQENLSIRDPEQLEPLPVNPGLKGWPTADWEATRRFPAPPITTYKSHTLKEKLPPSVGATLPQRDHTDTALIADMTDYRGRIPLKPGNWAFDASGEALPDKDNDGMHDEWEKSNGLNPARPDASQDNNANGYSNIEEWIFSLGASGP